MTSKPSIQCKKPIMTFCKGNPEENLLESREKYSQLLSISLSPFEFFIDQGLLGVVFVF